MIYFCKYTEFNAGPVDSIRNHNNLNLVGRNSEDFLSKVDKGTITVTFDMLSKICLYLRNNKEF